MSYAPRHIFYSAMIDLIHRTQAAASNTALELVTKGVVSLCNEPVYVMKLSTHVPLRSETKSQCSVVRRVLPSAGVSNAERDETVLRIASNMQYILGLLPAHHIVHIQPDATSTPKNPIITSFKTDFLASFKFTYNFSPSQACRACTASDLKNTS